MDAKIQLFRLRRVFESALACLGALAVVVVLLAKPYPIAIGGLELDKFAMFPLVMVLGFWAPRLALRRRTWRGTLEVAAGRLSIRTWARRRDLGVIRGAHVARGRRGGSVLFETQDGTTITARVADAREAVWLVEQLRPAFGTAAVTVPRAAFSEVIPIFTWFGTAMAACYYAHVVLGVIGGDKALYGLSALGAGIFVLTLTLARGRSPLHLRGATVEADSEQIDLGVGAALAARPVANAAQREDAAAIRKAVGTVPRAIRKQVQEHLRAVARPLPEGRAPDREAPEVWLTRMRAELSQDDGAYRGQRVGAIARIERLAGDASEPVTTRALAVRVLAATTPKGEARPRIEAYGKASPEDAALVEAVAGAESDAAAQRLVRRRRLDFEP